MVSSFALKDNIVGQPKWEAKLKELTELNMLIPDQVLSPVIQPKLSVRKTDTGVKLLKLDRQL